MAIHALDTQLFVALKAFIRKDGKVLVLRDTDRVGLDFPGGKYRVDGQIEGELLREVNEETGLSIKIGRPFHVWTEKYASHPDHQIDVFLIGFLCDYISGEVRLSEEHNKFEWVDEKTAATWKENTGYWKALEEFFKNKLDD